MRQFFRFAKIEHYVFTYPLVLAGAVLGGGGAWPSWPTALGLLAAGVSAQTLGMAVNRILDRRLDALNPRTADRELPAGRMTLAAAWAVAAGSLAAYAASCWALGPLCVVLAPVPAAVIVVYSLLKRFTSLCHFGIGLCLAMAPLGAYVAVTGELRFSADVLLLAGFALGWMTGFDIIYALQDIVSDRATGVRSIPARLGLRGAQAVAAGLHLGSAAALAALWRAMGPTPGSTAAAAVMTAGFALAYWPKLPLEARFFPLSAVAGVGGAMVVLLA